MPTKESIKYFATREAWRKWLETNFETAAEIWFVHPKKTSDRKAISYNDAVEEALCFGWIDSTVKSLNETERIQRFTPRKPKSPYSQPNKERLQWLFENEKIHPKLLSEVQKVLSEPFVFPDDILDTLKADKTLWENFNHFSDSYKRIRIAYIDDARRRPEEFEKRLNNFIAKTKENKKIAGFGGIDKYY
ncbi:YdeI family protein [Capnocytophaga cynodegmi]|uniref:YdeI/OmpD-associated family protein n=1 Tax=Capnocytophaga cynodegmi TaxID=28189 RepID=UPI00385CBDE1